jgi:hypothetical protein
MNEMVEFAAIMQATQADAADVMGAQAWNIANPRMRILNSWRSSTMRSLTSLARCA